MVIVLVVFLVFAAFGALALRFGTDSRDGGDWQPLDLMTPRCTRR
ncbi:hypothetical protein ACXR2U_07140 [Jatrophihabitans sp. YIM 134969]